MNCFVLIVAILWSVGVSSASSVEMDGLLSQDRIVGGQLSANHGRPYMVLMTMFIPSKKGGYTRTLCAGNLLNENWILTVAHCKADVAINYTLHLGMNTWCIGNQTHFSDGHEERKIGQYIVHPDFDNDTLVSDIGLIKMDQPVTLGGNIQVIQLPSREPFPGELMTVAGWGSTVDNGIFSCELREVELEVIPDTICMPLNWCDYSQFCAGWKDGGRDSCRGDSGGGLVTNNADGLVVHGLVSFGDECGEPYKPGFYTKVSNFTSWIKGYLTQ